MTDSFDVGITFKSSCHGDRQVQWRRYAEALKCLSYLESWLGTDFSIGMRPNCVSANENPSFSTQLCRNNNRSGISIERRRLTLCLHRQRIPISDTFLLLLLRIRCFIWYSFAQRMIDVEQLRVSHLVSNEIRLGAWEQELNGERYRSSRINICCFPHSRLHKSPTDWSSPFVDFLRMKRTAESPCGMAGDAKRELNVNQRTYTRAYVTIIFCLRLPACRRRRRIVRSIDQLAIT